MKHSCKQCAASQIICQTQHTAEQCAKQVCLRPLQVKHLLTGLSIKVDMSYDVSNPQKQTFPDAYLIHNEEHSFV